METKDQKDPIKDDQFGNAENMQNTSDQNEHQSSNDSDDEQPESTSDSIDDERKKTDNQSETETAEDTKEEVDEVAEPRAKEDVKSNPQAETTKEPEQHINDEKEEHDNENAPAAKSENEAEATTKSNEDEEVDFALLSREELIEKLAALISSKPIHQIRADVDSIKVNFYKKHKAEYERKRKDWVDSGGDIEEFEAPNDMLEPQIKELFKQYRAKKAEYNRDLEKVKQHNLELKQAIIEEIKELVNRNESVNKTFQDFRELQQRFRDVGPVPQASLNDLWETYHHHVQNFYDYVKINKELKDLDLKKNLEEKISLCEKAEELLLEPAIVVAFKKLQKLHNQWREVGPVPHEHRNEIWDRFKEVTTAINKKHQEHFETLREEQKSNLEAKKALCENAERIAETDIKSTKDWNKYSKEMIELQKVWKTIGFAPKKDNNKIYDRFRAACDSFFNRKREFYKESREEQLNNLQLKTELCIQAEGIKDSTEWKKTTEELINLQKRWKEIGPVPRKNSDEVWKRFRAACDYFFNNKSEHFATVDNKYEKNLKDKEALVSEIQDFKAGENVEESLKKLKEFQRRWAEIGFVPIKKKDELQKAYREAINKHFENLKIDNSRKNILRFKTKVDTLQGNPKGENKLRFERDKLFNQLKQLENDIVLWENNIGFFAKSKNAEQLKKEVEKKIEKARADIKVITEKIRLIDSME
ncbi:MAG: DUF349 domain-containing protein [Bacteroidales bacterium]